MNAKCAECQGACCSFRTMGIAYTDLLGMSGVGRLADQPNLGQDLLRKDGKLPRMRFFERGGQMMFECLHRAESGKCRIYAQRPIMCRTFRCPALKREMTVVELKGRNPPPPGRQGKEVTKQVRSYLKSLGRD